MTGDRHTELGAGQSPSQCYKPIGGIEQGSRHLIFSRWLGTNILWTQLKVVILKGALGKTKGEFVVGLQSLGPYLNVQTLDMSRESSICKMPRRHLKTAAFFITGSQEI